MDLTIKEMDDLINSHGGVNITAPLTAYNIMRKFFDQEYEQFYVIALGSSKKIIKIEMIFKGTVDACLVHPRDIFRFAIINNASSIIICHNHPSGERKPSIQDDALTLRIRKAGELLKISVNDHLIICKDGYYSYAEQEKIL